jgi:hypothetical protein
VVEEPVLRPTVVVDRDRVPLTCFSKYMLMPMYCITVVVNCVESMGSSSTPSRREPHEVGPRSNSVHGSHGDPHGLPWRPPPGVCARIVTTRVKRLVGPEGHKTEALWRDIVG